MCWPCCRCVLFIKKSLFGHQSPSTVNPTKKGRIKNPTTTQALKTLTVKTYSKKSNYRNLREKNLRKNGFFCWGQEPIKARPCFDPSLARWRMPRAVRWFGTAAAACFRQVGWRICCFCSCCCCSSSSCCCCCCCYSCRWSCCFLKTQHFKRDTVYIDINETMYVLL